MVRRLKTLNKFNFYSVYLDEMNKLSGREFKKLVNALSDYADVSKLPDKLSRKAMCIFTEIQRVISAEKDQEILSEKRSKAGVKGAKRRWKAK